MRDAVELGANRRVDARMAMAMDVAPHAARAVEIFVAVDVDQAAALGTGDHQRLVFRHLREGVPMVTAIPFQQLGTRGLNGHGIRFTT